MPFASGVPAPVEVIERWHRWRGFRYRVWERPTTRRDAPTLVLIHGYAACAEQWGRFIRDIGPDICVYAVDLIGFGEASKPRHAPYGRDFYVGQLEHLRTIYGWPAVVAVGHSFGGMLAIEWATTHPDALSSVIAIAPGGLLSGDELTDRQRAVLKRFAVPLPTWLLYHLITRLPYRLLSASAYADRAAIDPTTTRAIRRAMRDPGALWSFSALARFPEAFRTTAHPDLLRCPLHIIWGSRDGEVSEAHIARLQRAFAAATLTRLEGAGHCVHEERSREVAAEVRTLLVTDGLLPPAPPPDW